ncbi:hypothetical protein BV22DRAFT_1042043 [Leucogyrophana mollusca]|uniref:Uncharacterized protein n=1 Tax=Leucogyrophana mollusca TaxID=85980 RepID=A0ACB8AZY4_9AGAM|nr:hypothetical protein BV22DRAFT_1042043 [Leucogyrophana mollusca]
MTSQSSSTPSPDRPACESPPAQISRGGTGVVKRRSQVESRPVMIGSPAVYARYVIGEHEMPEPFAKLLLGTVDMNFEVTSRFALESYTASCILVEALDKERTALEEKRTHFSMMVDLMSKRITDLDEARSKAREAVDVTFNLMKEVQVGEESPLDLL